MHSSPAINCMLKIRKERMHLRFTTQFSMFKALKRCTNYLQNTTQIKQSELLQHKMEVMAALRLRHSEHTLNLLDERNEQTLCEVTPSISIEHYYNMSQHSPIKDTLGLPCQGKRFGGLQAFVAFTLRPIVLKTSVHVSLMWVA